MEKKLIQFYRFLENDLLYVIEMTYTTVGVNATELGLSYLNTPTPFLSD